MASGDKDEDELPEDLEQGDDDGSDLDDDADGESDEAEEDADEGRSGFSVPKAAGRSRSRARRKAAPKKKVSGNSVGVDAKGKIEFNIGGLSSAKLAVIFAAGSSRTLRCWGWRSACS